LIFGGIKNKIMKDIIMGVIRHFLTSFGGGLIVKGLLTAAQFNEILGAAMALIGLIWSVLDKANRLPQSTIK